MKVHIMVGFNDAVELNPSTVDIIEGTAPSDKYYLFLDKKWQKFCKDHNFSPTKDANGKIYDLYLQLCAEGII